MATTGKMTAAKRRVRTPAAEPPAIDPAAARDFAAAHLPGAEVRGKSVGVSFLVAGKVFAFTKSKGLVVKLAPEAIAELIAAREAKHLVMGKRVMREWAFLPLSSCEDYVEELPLLKSALAFVRSLEEDKR